MSDQIFLYLLGAGASCGALPMANNFSERLNKFKEEYNSDRSDDSFIRGVDLSQIEPLQFENDFLDSCAWLADETEKHESVDTYAKKLFIRGEMQSLNRLKNTLSCFFVLEQANHNVDKRYDSYFASIIESTISRTIQIPNKVRIVTWNYDMQLEKAYFEYCNSEDDLLKNITFSDRVVRLNGMAGTLQHGHISEHTKCVFRPYDMNTIVKVLEMYSLYKNSPNTNFPNISFAWESDLAYLERRISKAIKDVTVLIVIGYSFPFFNRQIDRMILKKLTNLKKIYIQAPASDHDSLVDRLQALLKDVPALKPISDIKRFYIPYEF